jgi:hypothetical protein
MLRLRLSKSAPIVPKSLRNRHLERYVAAAFMRIPVALIVILVTAQAARAQTPPDTQRGIPRFPLEYTGTVLSGPPRAGIPIHDGGQNAAVHGDELGRFDVAIRGNEVVRDLRLGFRLLESDSVITGESLVRTVMKRPEGLTIVYSHPAFTVREHLFVPLHEPAVILLLDVESVRPVEVHVGMREGSASYVHIAGQPADKLPFVLRVDARTAAYIPIIIADRSSPDPAGMHVRLAADARRHWREKVARYRALRTDLLGVESPETRMNQSLEWAKVELDHQANAPSITTLAMSATGQFALARDALSNPGVAATPAWMLACHEYWIASGDDAFLREMWPNIADGFRRAAGRDANADGLIEDPGFEIRMGGLWVAALESVRQMARAMKDVATQTRASQMADAAHVTLEKNLWMASAGLYASTPERPHQLTAWPAIAMAFAVLDAERSDRMLREIGSSAITADWGARALSRYDSLYAPLQRDSGAVTPFMTGFAAMAQYRHHRAWAGLDLVRDVARMMADFERGRAPSVLSGAFYQSIDAPASSASGESAMFAWPLIRGLMGWQVDAPHRAAAFEPHLPPEWASARMTGLRIGRDRIDAAITRERGMYAVSLRRLTSGAPVSIRVAPALPLGARVERIVVDDRDVEIQAEESVHDLHAVADVTLLRDAQVEFHYSGGIEVIAPPERVEPGDASQELKVLDFRRESREYVLLLEGLAGDSYTLQLRAETQVRAAIGADSFEQGEERITLRVTLPEGDGYIRKTIRLRP